MAKLSQTVKEIIQIVVFLLVVGILVTVFLVYPLGRAKAFFARPEAEVVKIDSLPANDPTAFLDLGAAVDTFRIDSDGLTNLACLYLTPQPDSTNPEKITSVNRSAILVHDAGLDRTSLIPMAQVLLDSGFAVCVYDQRAAGFSSGAYRSNGEYEAADLAELIGYLGLRDQLPPPFIVVGLGLGGDAAILAAAEEPRIDGIVVTDPNLTSERWLDRMIEEHEMYWIPFSHTLLKFWYELRSGYAPDYVTLDNLQGVNCPTLVLGREDIGETDAYMRLVEESAEGVITLKTGENDAETLYREILEFSDAVGPTAEVETIDTP